MSIKREEGVRRGDYLGLFLLFSAPIRIFIYASGNPYFRRSDFCALYYIQPALQNQNKFLNFASETNRDRRLVLYTCLSPPIVSGKAFLSCTTYLLKVYATFLVKLLPINCSHAKSKAFAFRLLFFKQQLLTRPDLWRPPLYSKSSDHI